MFDSQDIEIPRLGALEFSSLLKEDVSTLNCTFCLEKWRKPKAPSPRFFFSNFVVGVRRLGLAFHLEKWRKPRPCCYSECLGWSASWLNTKDLQPRFPLLHFLAMVMVLIFKKTWKPQVLFHFFCNEQKFPYFSNFPFRHLHFLFEAYG